MKTDIEEFLMKRGYEKSFQCEEDKLRTYSNSNESVKIQLIDIAPNLSPSHLIDTFDINACRFAWDGKYFYTDKAAIKDIKNNHISIHDLTYPVATIKRIAKYRLKGYKITQASLDFVRILTERISAGINIDRETVYVD